MDSRVKHYIRHGKFYVDGWLRTEAALVIAALSERQHSLGMGGGEAEIGVHHGKRFILHYVLSHAPEKAVTIDLFGDQHLNVDLSGSGYLQKFRRNLARYADDERLVLHQGNSLELGGADLVRLAAGPLRFTSVDGGHTADITAHDLGTAEASLADGGIIVVDDVFNERWPGVGDGVHPYFVNPRYLRPFGLRANKTYFCRPSHRDAYFEAAVSAATAATTTQFLSEPVAFLQFERLRLNERVAASRAWQRLRTTPIGWPLRWAFHTGRR